MRRHDPRASLYDVLQAGDAIGAFLDGRSSDDYAADPMLRAAVERKFEIVGEALARALQADPNLAERLPEAREAIGLRNVIAHGYDELVDDIVQRTARVDLPVLLERVRAIMEESVSA